MIDKRDPNNLAVFGGKPAFQDKLHVNLPNPCNRERLFERVDEILDRRWLTNNGPCVQELERRLAEILGVRNCVLTCNGTIALEMAIRACGLKGEVIVPSFTFIATAHALRWQGITPVFGDIDPDTHNLDPRHIEELITPRTTGIVGVHLWGRPCDVESLAEIARRRQLRLLLDAAHAFGCSHRGLMVGGMGDAEAFSFHATKYFNTLEGGAVTTNDDALARKVRLMKDLGFADYDFVAGLGTNGRMNEVSAAVGLTMLEDLDGMIMVNRRNYDQYQRGLKRTPGVRLVTYDETERNNYQYIVLEIDEAVTQVTRDQLMDVLWTENVKARRYFYPGCHRMEPYRSDQPEAGKHLPQTEKVAERVLALPNGKAIGMEDASLICEIIRTTVAHGPEVRRRLEEQPTARSYRRERRSSDT